MSEKSFNKFLIERLKKLDNNYDISTFNYLQVDFLNKYLPNAKYLFPLRSFESWLNSFINHIRADHILYGNHEWQNKLGKALMGEWFKKEYFYSEENIDKNIDVILTNTSLIWNDGISKVLKNKPQNILIYRYSLIDEDVDFLIDFLRLPKSKVDISNRFKNKAFFKVNYSKRYETLVQSIKNMHCNEAILELTKQGIDNIDNFKFKR